MSGAGNGEGQEKPEVSRLLVAWAARDGAALDRLAPLVYPKLRAIARRYLRNERVGHTLQTTALVNEAFLDLVGAGKAGFQDQAHFFAFSAQIMRRILIDAARARASQKRGGGEEPVHALNLDEIPASSPGGSNQMLALEDALLRLEQMDKRKAKVVELRFFAGLSVEECAAVLNVSAQTVLRDWKLARVWLARELNNSAAH